MIKICGKLKLKMSSIVLPKGALHSLSVTMKLLTALGIFSLGSLLSLSLILEKDFGPIYNIHNYQEIHIIQYVIKPC